MTTISPTAADIIGLVGSVLFIAGFAYANVAKELNQLWFNAVNLVGAVLLLISLSVHFNLAAFVLESAWGTIAAMGLVRAMWVRFGPPRNGEVAAKLTEGSALATPVGNAPRPLHHPAGGPPPRSGEES